jgi:hypothetical protein
MYILELIFIKHVAVAISTFGKIQISYTQKMSEDLIVFDTLQLKKALTSNHFSSFVVKNDNISSI